MQTEEVLVHMLAGACSVLRADNCALVGGHTSEGSELSMGFAITGTADAASVLRKGPPKSGDILILTKPLGTGCILAADMRGKASGRWVKGAIASMLISNKAAAAVLAQHECRACTDVTGFGFMGHLLEMLQFNRRSDDDDDTNECDDSHLQATVTVSSLPILSGARECVAAGILSSLQPEVFCSICYLFVCITASRYSCCRIIELQEPFKIHPSMCLQESILFYSILRFWQ